MSAESFSPPQGQIINQQTTELTAQQHMEALGGKLETASFTAGFTTEIGKGKNETLDSNQDVHLIVTDEKTGDTLFGVFDGAGGMGGGHVAAQTAGEVMYKEALQNKAYGTPVQNGPNHLAYQVKIMQEAVAKKGAETGNHKMSTTALLGLLQENAPGFEGKKMLTVAAIGDSLGYLVRGGTVYALNQEESYSAELLRQGKSVEEADKYGYIITNSLTAETSQHEGLDTQNNLRQFEVLDGDVVYFFTDGVTGDTSAQRMKGYTSNNAAMLAIAQDATLTDSQKAERFIAISGKEHDDKTAIVMTIGAKKTSVPDTAPQEQGIAVESTQQLTVEVAEVKEAVPVEQAQEIGTVAVQNQAAVEDVTAAPEVEPIVVTKEKPEIKEVPKNRVTGELEQAINVDMYTLIGELNRLQQAPTHEISNAMYNLSEYAKKRPDDIRLSLQGAVLGTVRTPEMLNDIFKQEVTPKLKEVIGDTGDRAMRKLNSFIDGLKQALAYAPNAANPQAYLREARVSTGSELIRMTKNLDNDFTDGASTEAKHMFNVTLLGLIAGLSESVQDRQRAMDVLDRTLKKQM